MSTPLGKRRNVLIVDDDLINIFIAGEFLKNHFDVHGVVNGHEALNAVEKAHYDIILMDINLGDEKMDGLRTMRMIRNNRKNRNVKIFAVTTYSNSPELYIKQGFDEFFMKPVSEKLVEQLINIIVVENQKNIR